MLRLVWLGCLLAVCGCSSSDDKAPPAGGGSGTVLSGREPVTPRDDDAGEGLGSDDDAGFTLKRGVRCDNIDPPTGAVDLEPGQLENAAIAPDDFTVTRMQTRWLCDPAQLELTLSEGRCPNGDEHALVMTIDKAALEDGAIVGGQNVLMPEPDDLGLRLRYTRPLPLRPSGEWGTCAGASGTVDFLEAPETRARAIIQGRIVADLTACDESGARPMTVQATVHALVPTTYDAACPDS